MDRGRAESAGSGVTQHLALSIGEHEVAQGSQRVMDTFRYMEVIPGDPERGTWWVPQKVGFSVGTCLLSF